MLVNPPGPVQLNVKPLPLPPLGVAVSETDDAVLQATVLTDTVGFGFTVRVPEQVVVQPFESVTNTVYVPAVVTEIDDTLPAVKPPGPDQLKLYPGVPPLGVTVRV